MFTIGMITVQRRIFLITILVSNLSFQSLCAYSNSNTFSGVRVVRVRVVRVSQVYLNVCSSALRFIGLHNIEAIKVSLKHVPTFEIEFSRFCVCVAICVLCNEQ